MSNKIKIAVDAMGSDNAPIADITGSIKSIKDSKETDFNIILVGDKDKLNFELSKHNNYDKSRITIHHASDVITMKDEPALAVRSKRESSIVKGINLHKDSGADAFISAGNTGAVMAASTLILGRINGVSRPTIAALFPSTQGFTVVADVGANVDTKPQNLYEFAVMTSIYAEQILGYINPTIALLSVGEEESKGDERTQEAYKLIKQSKLNFVGNVEGRDILGNKARVIICDGFSGNVVLKLTESIPKLLKTKLVEFSKKSLFNKIITGLSKGTLKKVLEELDYQEYGGVPLLGVNGVTIIGHGSSNEKAMKNMILKAREMVIKQVNMRIAEELSN